MPAYPSSPHAFKKIKKPLHSSDLVRLIEPCGPLHDGEPKLYDRCSCSYAYGIRVRVHDGASLVGMYASCVFTSIRDFYLQKLCNSILIISWITSISKRIRVNQSLTHVWLNPIWPLYAISAFFIPCLECNVMMYLLDIIIGFKGIHELFKCCQVFSLKRDFGLW